MQPQSIDKVISSSSVSYMKRFILVFVFSLLFSFENQAQFQFSKKQLIGIWEIDYNSLKTCDNGLVKPVQKTGRCTIEFIDSFTYTKNTWGEVSTGYYSIDETQGDIVFDPTVEPITMDLNQTRSKVVSVTDDTLTFLINNCSALYEQSYFKLKSNKQLTR